MVGYFQVDVEIMERERELKMKAKDIELQNAVKDNEIAVQHKLMEVSLRMKEVRVSLPASCYAHVCVGTQVELRVAEERARTELVEARRHNTVMESTFEGRAQGVSVLYLCISFHLASAHVVSLQENIKAFFEALPSSMPETTKLMVLK
jgi:hypothetical protein